MYTTYLAYLPQNSELKQLLETDDDVIGECSPHNRKWDIGEIKQFRCTKS